jgi:starvation-inducible DNA-binding protein
MSTKTGVEVKATPIDIGIGEGDRKEIAAGLSRLLADNFTLYMKTHNFHWNVTGPMFRTLHVMFEEQYNELWTANDDIAERIRSLGVFAPATFREFTQLATIKEEEGVPQALQMVRQLVAGHEAAARTARSVLETAEGAHDAPTADLLTERLQVHEKTAWMLRSLLAEEAGTQTSTQANAQPA